MVKEILLTNFNLYCFKSSKNSENENVYDKFIKRDDFFVSLSKRDFILFIRGVSSKRLSYINYWKENAQKQMIDIFDELIDKRLEIEFEILDYDFDIYLIRKKDNKINYLKEGDLIIESNKIIKKINKSLEVIANSFSYKFENRLSDLETRMNKVQTHNFFSYDNFLLNPNLKLAGSKYKSKLDI